MSRLPKSWVDFIFMKMLATYGSGWTRLWEGIPPEAMSEEWATELGCYANRRDVLSYAMEYLPEQPPNLRQFKALCNRAPESTPPALPAPPVDRARVAKGLARLNELRRSSGPQSSVDRLLEMRSQGKTLSAGQRDFLARALAGSRPVTTVEQLGEFVPIPVDILPPGMQPRG